MGSDMHCAWEWELKGVGAKFISMEGKPWAKYPGVWWLNWLLVDESLAGREWVGQGAD